MEYRRSDFIPPENHLCYPLSSHQYRGIMSPVSGVQFNPDSLGNLYEQSLVTALSRLDISTPTRQSLFPVMSGLPGSNGGGSTMGNNSYIDSSTGASFPHLSYQQVQQTMELQRLRIESTVMEQMGLYMPPNGISVLANENLGGLSSSSNAFNDYQLTQESSYGYLNGRYSNSNGFLLNSDFQSRGKSINGMELENSNTLMSNLKNNHKFRSRQRPNYSSLEELRGQISMVVKEQNGCRFLQTKIEEGKPEYIHMIFLELKDHVCELMVDHSGNVLIQKLFEFCNEEQITKVLLSVFSNEDTLMAICLDMHGTLSMQKLLDNLRSQEQISAVVSVLRPYTITLSKNINGHHVIQQCLKLFSYEDNKYILNEVADDLLDIATDKNGCCVLQQSITRAQGVLRERLVAEIIENALAFSGHPFGNYVVQYVLEMRIPRYTAEILEQLVGSHVCLSLNKFGSNVVESCLTESTDEQSSWIIWEIINSPKFLMVLQDVYGNYVAQSALLTSKGAIRNALVNLIESHYPFLHGHPQGKRVLARTRRIKRHVSFVKCRVLTPSGMV